MLTDDQLNQQIADRLRAMRIAHVLSRREMMDLTGEPANTVKNYELAYRKPNAIYLVRLARYFGNDWISWVMGFTDIQPAVVEKMIGTTVNTSRIS